MGDKAGHDHRVTPTVARAANLNGLSITLNPGKIVESSREL